MNSLRKWLYRPKKTDNSLLAQFYFADEELNQVAAELDSFDGRKDPERCTILVNVLRSCQDKVLTTVQQIMDEAIPVQRANRDFRVKFPDDVLQESLAGQLWFGAECLAAGSSILNREVESASMRPLARALTKNLDSLRCVLRDQCLRNITEYTERITEALIIFDKLFAEFELSYVSAMVPVKTMKEYDMMQEVTILFSETVQRALRVGLLTQDMIDDYDPALMFTIPRLAIVCGLLIYPEGPLNPDMDATSMSEMYRPFQTLLFKIRELLYTLSPAEFSQLEKSLCTSQEPEVSTPAVDTHSRSLTEMGDPPETLIDQGFDEGGSEILVPFDSIGSPILVHTASSGSPVTPINMNPDLTEFEISPSSTIVGGSFHFSPTSSMNRSLNEGFSNLNKSESQDSGLHSENVSTSDTVIVDAPPLTSQEAGGATACKLPPSEEVSEGEVISSCEPQADHSTDVTGDCVSKGDSNIEALSCESSVSNDELCLKNCCRLDTGSGVRHMCREIIDDLVTDAVQSSVDKSTDTGPSDSPATRPRDFHSQFSWQYNVQFAIPCISVSEQESHLINDRRSGSLSSDSTLSDHGQQDNMVDFVINALTGIDGPTAADSIATIPNTDSQTTSTPADPSPTPNNCDTSEPSTQMNHDLSPDQSVQTSTNSTETSTNTLPNNTLSVTNSPLHACDNQKRRERRRGSFERIHCKTGSQTGERVAVAGECVADAGEGVADLQRVQRLQYTESISSSCSSCRSTSSVSSECDCDKDCTCAGSETSSYNSETNDEEEIALAIQAAELTSRNEARSRFRSSSDLIHRLFVCIAGVADQLQTNYAADLRHILKCVFEVNCKNPYVTEDPEVDECQDVVTLEGQDEGESASTQTEFPDESDDTMGDGASALPPPSPQRNTRPQPSPRHMFDPPAWVPDQEAPGCISCKIPFTFVRRRHHCRNCGKVFCGRCSSNSVPLPQYGHQNAVRVCNRCFMFQVPHFTVDD